MLNKKKKLQTELDDLKRELLTQVNDAIVHQSEYTAKLREKDEALTNRDNQIESLLAEVNQAYAYQEDLKAQLEEAKAVSTPKVRAPRTSRKKD